MWSRITELFAENEAVVWWTLVVSLAVFVGSLLLMPVVVARLPADYFAELERPATWMDRRHPGLRVVLTALKNALGVVLFVAGVAMLVLPGQGLLTMLAAVVLLDFPGKRRLELAVVRRPRVLRALNWIRRRGRTVPLVAPPESP